MLVASGTSRRENRRWLRANFKRAMVPMRLIVDRSRPVLEGESWCAYWRHCRPFFEADRRLVHRINQLKKAWLAIMRTPSSRDRQRMYCWRFFCLLHHTLRIARDEPDRTEPLNVLRRIVGFETFLVEVRGRPGIAAGLVSNRNPVFLLGRLPPNAPLPTPRHVPLVMPATAPSPFYCYRQLQLALDPEVTIFVCPSVDLKCRATSFGPIDRLFRLLSDRGDPRWKPRARLLSHRVLLPLLPCLSRSRQQAYRRTPFAVLDLGAGTGHLTAVARREACRSLPAGRRQAASLHFVDAAGPCFGRSFGLARETENVSHVEWTKADYRELLDDDDWLHSNAPFDLVLMCRLLGNASIMIIEEVGAPGNTSPVDLHNCCPSKCLAPSQQPEGLRHLRVRTVRRSRVGGTFMPQFSLTDYFAAMRAVGAGMLDAAVPGSCYLPVRRFNSAALTTVAGRSVIAQLLKVALAIVIEDVDLQPADLMGHRRQFGLDGTGAVHCTRDGFTTEAHHYVITSPACADRLGGNRLW